MTKFWPLSPTDNQFLTRIINTYLSARPLFYAFIRPQEALLFHQNQILIKPPILDFGCGDGFFAYNVFGDKSVDIGLDVVQSRITETNQWPAYKKVVTYDGYKIPFPNNHFQTVISNCVFEHLPNLKENLIEIHRVLKPGGCLLTSVATNYWDQYYIGTKYFGKPYSRWWRHHQVHHNLPTYSQWLSLFQTVGFDRPNILGYMSQNLVKLIELSHYLSLPSLFSYRLLHRWIIFPEFYQLFPLNKLITPHLTKALHTPPIVSATLFFVAGKQTKT